MQQIAEIEASLAKFGYYHILPMREAEIRYRATIEATHSSTSIEGNPLTRNQVNDLLQNKPILTRHKYAEIEVQNYAEALKYIDRRKTKSKPLHAGDILEIHHLITKGLLPDSKSGHWRTGDVYIQDQSGQIVYDAPSAATVEPEIYGLLAWLEQKASDIHPVIAAAILHYQLVSIHPFSDGNGRTTRAVVMLYLGLHNYDFNGSLTLDSYYATNRSEYYRALSNVQGSRYDSAKVADLTSWIEYFVEGFLASVHVLMAEVAMLSSVVTDATPTKRLLPAEVDIISYATQFGEVSLMEAEEFLSGVPRRTIQRYLANLVERGYLTRSGGGRSVIYIINR